MKKNNTIILPVVFAGLMSFCSCSNNISKDDSTNLKSSYSYGLDMISEMNDIVSDTHYKEIMVYDALDGIPEKIAQGDYSSPKAVYQLSFDFESMKEMYYEDFEKLSDVSKEYLKNKLPNSISSIINAHQGVSHVTASQIYKTSRIFVSSDSNEIDNTTAYLYVYDNTFPVMVNFNKGDGGAILAESTFILDEEFDCDNIESVQEYFK
ncbi:MAG: hypothetical protein K2G63_00325, partial [Oscillospiraceae bacterium]|nr:hypothetical protein [Oscillospiraceae bacterium]